MRALRLAAYELRRFRTPLQRAGLAFLAVVPLLYGGIYLWSNWDPYSKIDRVPVAVVDADRPVTVDGRRVQAGADFVAELKKDRILDWRFTGAADARDGLKAGRYLATISVPPDFSARLASGANGTPQKAAMMIELDDANNYLVGIMADTIKSELERKVSAAAVTAYFQAAFGKLGELRDGLGDAANGAAELHDGIAQAKDGSAQLADGLQTAKTGTGALVTGLGQAKDGSAQLASGLDTARTGTGALVTGLGQAKDGSGQLVTALGTAKSGTGALVTGLTSAKSGSAQLADGLDAAETGTGALVTALTAAKSGSSQLAGGLGTADQGTAQLADGLTRLKAGSGELAPGAAELATSLHALNTEAGPVATRAAEALPGLADTAVDATGDAARLSSLAASVSARIARITGQIDAWLNGLPADRPEIRRSVQYQRLQTSLRDLDGTVADRLRDLAAAYPAVADVPAYRGTLALAEQVDHALVSRLNRLADRHPELRADPVFQEILRIADRLTRDAREIARLAAGVDATAHRVAADAVALKKDVPALQAKLAGAASGLAALDRGGARVASGAAELDANLATAQKAGAALHAGTGKLLTGARSLDAGNARLLAGAQQLDAGGGRLASGAHQLDAGNTKLLAGARQLDTGSGKLLSGAQQLDAGNVKLLAGARQLDAGSGKLAAGAHRLDAGNTTLLNGAKELDAGNAKLAAGAEELDTGNAQLLSGSQKLADGLESAEKQVPSYGTDAAAGFANPVNVSTSNLHPAGNYGRGLAPFFIAIALWVFGIVAFLLLRPVSGRLLAGPAGAATVAFAAWLPVLFMGLVAALVLFLALQFGLGLDPVTTAGTLGVMALGLATFSAIVHVLRLAFGAVGDSLALFLLILQLVSCGGLYPVQTLPMPFRAIHDVVPMTYFVEPMRAVISGGERSIVLRDLTVLAGYLAVALALLVLVVRLQRRWTMSRLKPELEL
ncbi:YhgE/Pip domain-containing protein [Actinomadura parmotrematis]|uniref:YhgE/Pip domain-containing protein n=1 Tax=Actinomadura parmotrematis TaxID=2864039 RepID=A0ABS7FM19_9ACTN|nr:YhgE/Pip domain-containing protein [Actinomadura parmotrematis]MBW8481428.1 YhgE/Pip domain-containing protein [Actinomadura parmotrematis]